MEKIDWSKERTLKANFCGYCDNTPTGGSCDGTCFTRKDYDEKFKTANKIKHLENELESVYEAKKKLADRLKLLGVELQTLKHK